MQTPRALAALVATLARPSSGHDLSSVADLATPDTPSLLSLAGTDHARWRRELAQVALWRAFVATLPAFVFERPDLPCRARVARRLGHVLGEPPDPALLDDLMVIVKRLQRYLLFGRSSASFDVDSAFHAELLKRQAGRCAVCGYLFSAQDLDEDPSAGIAARVDTPVSGDWDRSPKRLARRAVLDHMLPIYLAGDDRQNWQVLCRTCNEGKSDLVFPFAGADWFGSARAMRLIRTRPRLFYMVLCRDGACATCGRGPQQVELRVRRRDNEGTDCYPNLVATCRSWSSLGQC